LYHKNFLFLSGHLRRSIGQKIGDYRLNEIASFFGLRHYGGVSSAIYSIVEALKLDEVLSKKINTIINRLDP
jgi:chromosomal replication initiation ATPase DnaA